MATDQASVKMHWNYCLMFLFEQPSSGSASRNIDNERCRSTVEIRLHPPDL
jgi:hypothetical protein